MRGKHLVDKYVVIHQDKRWRYYVIQIQLFEQRNSHEIENLSPCDDLRWGAELSKRVKERPEL